MKKKSEMLTLLSLFPSPVSSPPLPPIFLLALLCASCTLFVPLHGAPCTFLHNTNRRAQCQVPSSHPPPPPSNRLKSINRSDFQIEILSFLLEFDFCRIFQFQFQLQILQFLKKINNSYVYNMNYKRSIIFRHPPTNISHL